MDVKKLSIDDIGLSNRSMNALHRAEVHTVGEMLMHTEESLLGVKNLGKKSIEEILQKIEEYKNMNQKEKVPVDISEYFEEWIGTKEGQEIVLTYLKEQALQVEELELLSAKAYNLLMINGYTFLHQILFAEKEELLNIPRMEDGCADEIINLCKHYVLEKKEQFCDAFAKQQKDLQQEKLTIYDMISMPDYQDDILQYVQSHNKEIASLGLSNRAKNCLLKSNYTQLSEIIFKTKSEFQKIPSMGIGSIEEIMKKIEEYIEANEKKMMAVCTGDVSALWDDDTICDMILKLYQTIGFAGLNFQEIKERLQLPEQISDTQLKKLIGTLIANNELEYVDFRCYRVYGKFEIYLERCPELSERSRQFIQKRLQGMTLEAIAIENGVTRERVRQIVKRDVEKVRDWYKATTGMEWFDEDYYQYFYATYDFDKKDGMEWLGITTYIYQYLDMMDVKRGKKELQSALEDSQNLNVGLRLKIKNYLNRNKLYIDGMWIEKKRADLEELVIRKFCKNDVSFDEFTKIYNRFLEEEEIEFDPDIYCTDAVYRTRKNHLPDKRFLLWKQNEQIRYYDIDARDYTELFDTLNLDSYENIELSTVKFMEEYPEIMEKYDIRDQYELHNLLRKVVPEGSFHEFHCGRMPEIKFGTFDRNAAIFDLLIDHAPISITDLADIIHDEYGYDQAVIMGTYLQPFHEYYHQGMYVLDQKVMPVQKRVRLKSLLTEDFYYIDEIRRIYAKKVPGADLEEINPYNLKTMGFLVLSRYVLQNHASLEAYCEDILTREDIIDISNYRRRFVYVQMFSQKLMELKRNLEIIEFEPNQIINFRKLKSFGITKEMVQEYCDAVYDYVEDGTYFSAKSIRQSGFVSELHDLGFSDWFYANLLISDERFSFANMYGNLILYKGREDITIKSFEIALIKEAGSIDVFDLMSELEDVYGCQIKDKSDITYKVQGTEVYYDRFLDRLYANADLYYRELDDMEGI